MTPAAPYVFPLVELGLDQWVRVDRILGILPVDEEVQAQALQRREPVPLCAVVVDLGQGEQMVGSPLAPHDVIDRINQARADPQVFYAQLEEA